MWSTTSSTSAVTTSTITVTPVDGVCPAEVAGRVLDEGEAALNASAALALGEHAC